MTCIVAPTIHKPLGPRDFHLLPDQHNVLKNAFLFIPFLDNFPDTLDKLVSDTGLEKEFILTWFKNMRKRLNLDKDDESEQSDNLEKDIDQSVKESGICPVDYNPPPASEMDLDETDDSVDDFTVNDTNVVDESTETFSNDLTANDENVIVESTENTLNDSTANDTNVVYDSTDSDTNDDDDDNTVNDSIYVDKSFVMDKKDDDSLENETANFTQIIDGSITADEEHIVGDPTTKRQQMVADVIESDLKCVNATTKDVDEESSKSLVHQSEKSKDSEVFECEEEFNSAAEVNTSVMEVEHLEMDESIELVEEIVTNEDLPEITDSILEKMNIDNDEEAGPIVIELSDTEDEEADQEMKDTSIEEITPQIKKEMLSFDEKAVKYDVLKAEFSALQNKLENLSKVLGNHGMEVGESAPQTPSRYPPNPFHYQQHSPYFHPGSQHTPSSTPTEPSSSVSSEPTTTLVPKQEPQPYGWPNQDYNHQMYNQPWMQYPQQYPPVYPNGYASPYPPFNYSLPYPPPQYPYHNQPPMQGQISSLPSQAQEKPSEPQQLDSANATQPAQHYPQPYPYHNQPPMPGQNSPNSNQHYDPSKPMHQPYQGYYGQPYYPPPPISSHNVEPQLENQNKENLGQQATPSSGQPKHSNTFGSKSAQQVKPYKRRSKEVEKPILPKIGNTAKASSINHTRSNDRPNSPEVQTLYPPPTMPVLSPQVKPNRKQQRNSVPGLTGLALLASPTFQIGQFDKSIQDNNPFRRTKSQPYISREKPLNKTEPKIQTLYPPIQNSHPIGMANLKTYQRPNTPRDVPRTLQGLSGVSVQKVPPPILPQMGNAVSTQPVYSPLSDQNQPKEVQRILSMSNLSVSMGKK